MTDLTPDDLAERESRRCGSCKECCVHLGVDAPTLQKHAGANCCHLSKTRTERRCTIYKNRPDACVRFRCLWLQGILRSDFQPNRCGVLVSMYPKDGIETPTATNHVSATVVVTDTRKCGHFLDKKGSLYEIVYDLTTSGIDDVRIVNYKSLNVLHFYLGLIYHGKLLPTSKPEQLSFETYNPPIGKYIVSDSRNLP